MFLFQVVDYIKVKTSMKWHFIFMLNCILHKKVQNHFIKRALFVLGVPFRH